MIAIFNGIMIYEYFETEDEYGVKHMPSARAEG